VEIDHMLDTLTLRETPTSNEPTTDDASRDVDSRADESRDAGPGDHVRASDPPCMPEPVRREARPCVAKDPVLVLVYRALDTSFDALQRELPRVWAGDTVTGVHRMRMATRRTRAVLRAFRDILPRESTSSLANEAAWLAGELGSVRDLDVYLAQLDRATADLPPELRADLEPHMARIRAQRAAAHRALLESLAGARYAQMSAEFARYLDEGPPAAALRRARGLNAREGAEDFALRALKRARKTGRHITGDSQAERQHKLRLRCKRLRYLLESFEPLYGEQLDGTIKSLKRVQDALGDLRDVTAAAGRLREQADNASDFALPGASDDERTRCRIACRMLMHLQEAEAVHAQQRFDRSWQQFDQRGRKKKLRRIMRRSRRTVTTEPVAATRA